ncbi:MAG TPA: Hpt domain-containing protein, partial [Pseudomonadales bacterium]|nr:Hpt domain-containing protein [Pseudomonadales bacterium]
AISSAMLSKSNLKISMSKSAHAMADEKEDLLKAGMNDYQTKPITPDRLIKTISQWTDFQGPTKTFGPISTPLKKHNNQLFFDAELALYHVNKSADLAIDIFKLLLESMAEDIAAIMEAWEEEDIGTLLELVHKIHGASRYCGVPKLRDVLEAFESSLKSGKSDQWPEFMRNLVEESSSLQHWASSNDWQQLILDSNAA